MLDGNGSITGGSIMYDGKDLAKFKKEKEWMTIRGKKIAMVMQDPMTSLNPLKRLESRSRSVSSFIRVLRSCRKEGNSSDS